MSMLQDLKKKIYVEPPTETSRPYLIEFIKLRTEEAKRLTKKDRFAKQGDGWDIASDIVGAIAHHWPGEGLDQNNWLNEKSEPVLYGILETTWTLDESGNHPEEWDKLFKLVEKLK